MGSICPQLHRARGTAKRAKAGFQPASLNDPPPPRVFCRDRRWCSFGLRLPRTQAGAPPEPRASASCRRFGESATGKGTGRGRGQGGIVESLHTYKQSRRRPSGGQEDLVPARAWVCGEGRRPGSESRSQTAQPCAGRTIAERSGVCGLQGYLAPPPQVPRDQSLRIPRQVSDARYRGWR